VKTTETVKAAPKPRSATRKQASSKPVSAQQVFARAKAVKR